MSSEKHENQTKAYKAFIVMDAQVFPIDKPLTSIGRDFSNDLVIQNAQVSRVHAEVRYINDTFEIVDLESTGGTYVNNVKVKQSKIFSGDLILVADVPLMFLSGKESIYQELEKQTVKMKKKEDENTTS
ncbi:MAG: FHA domain-containing protein [Anaerolineales bacterium]|jgi:pSer/pThr/pTyr-binding forkhead associated (FHA) protein